MESKRASDGSFTKELAEPSRVPTELGIQGAWTGSNEFWDKWVDDRIGAYRNNIPVDDSAIPSTG